MSYRDDEDALKAEAEELRRQIASVREESTRQRLANDMKAATDEPPISARRGALYAFLGCLGLVLLAALALIVLGRGALLMGPG